MVRQRAFIWMLAFITCFSFNSMTANAETVTIHAFATDPVMVFDKNGNYVDELPRAQFKDRIKAISLPSGFVAFEHDGKTLYVDEADVTMEVTRSTGSDGCLAKGALAQNTDRTSLAALGGGEGC